MRLRQDRKEQRKREGQARNEAWSRLTNEQKLQRLDARGVTAARQRAKLAA